MGGRDLPDRRQIARCHHLAIVIKRVLVAFGEADLTAGLLFFKIWCKKSALSSVSGGER